MKIMHGRSTLISLLTRSQRGFLCRRRGSQLWNAVAAATAVVAAVARRIPDRSRRRHSDRRRAIARIRRRRDGGVRVRTPRKSGFAPKARTSARSSPGLSRAAGASAARSQSPKPFVADRSHGPDHVQIADRLCAQGPAICRRAPERASCKAGERSRPKVDVGPEAHRGPERRGRLDGGGGDSE